MNDDSESEQKVKIRYWAYPVSLIRLYETDVINAEEVMLLGKINTYEKCYASNKYLAAWWKNKSHNWVSTSLKKLEKLGVITCEYSGKRRLIRTCFDGEECNIGENGDLRKVKPTFKKSVRPSKYSKIIPCDAHASLDGGGLFKDGIPKNKDAVRLTKLYHEFLIKNNLHKGRADLPSGNSEMSIKKRRSTLSKWITYCSELLERYDGDADLIERTIIWYFKNIGDSYLGTYLSMKTFGDCENFEKIQKAMRREKESKGSKLSKYRFKINGKPVEEDED